MTSDDADVLPDLIEPRDLAPLFEDDPDTPLWMQTVADLCDDIALVLDEITTPPLAGESHSEEDSGDRDDEDDTTEEGQ